jgi:hypothetical protein
MCSGEPTVSWPTSRVTVVLHPVPDTWAPPCTRPGTDVVASLVNGVERRDAGSFTGFPLTFRGDDAEGADHRLAARTSFQMPHV